MDDCCECRGRHGAFYACLGANGFMFVVLMCINPMFGVIYLFCIAALVAVCVGFAQARCLCETCETRETREHIDVDGVRHWYCGYPFQKCQATHLRDLGVLDGAEWRAFLRWRDAGLPPRYVPDESIDDRPMTLMHLCWRD
jgi:hypothetical protein